MIKKVFIFFTILVISFSGTSYATSTYGSLMPSKGKLEMGYEYQVMFKRDLWKDHGDLSGQEQFFTASMGITDWLSIDGKVGCGDGVHDNDKYLPEKVDYAYGFAGGYGFRIRAYKNEDYKIRVIVGAHHISVHPPARHKGSNKYRATLDDWDVSAIVARDFDIITPYIGIKGSDGQIIEKHNDNGFKKMHSKDYVGLVVGGDLQFFDGNLRINIEGRFFDETAMSCNVRYVF